MHVNLTKNSIVMMAHGKLIIKYYIFSEGKFLTLKLAGICNGKLYCPNEPDSIIFEDLH